MRASLSLKIGHKVIVAREHLQSLFDALTHRHYQLIGPTIRDRAIIYDNITGVEELPIGWTEFQDVGTYRLKKRDDQALFGYVLGSHSWKTFLHLPARDLWQAERNGNGFALREETNSPPFKFAFIGVRSCDLHAITIQDKILMEGPYIDATYTARREGTFIVAVNCRQSSETCFCASVGTGPKATSGFDLSLIEILRSDAGPKQSHHYFEVEVGTELGAQILQDVPFRILHKNEAVGERILTATTNTMLTKGTRINIDGLKNVLYGNYEHPHWDEIASRCLTCGNCTMICPTCFCTSVEDFTDLDGKHAERWQKWDSCFTLDFSYIHGGIVRGSPKARYRHWLMHKFATWIDQFGTLGCVGCGRCAVWCPVGINIAEEVRVIGGDVTGGQTQWF